MTRVKPGSKINLVSACLGVLSCSMAVAPVPHGSQIKAWQRSDTGRIHGAEVLATRSDSVNENMPYNTFISRRRAE